MTKKAVEESRAAEIRAKFAALGGNVPLPILAKGCCDDKIFLPEEIQAHAMKWCVEVCRQALRAEDRLTRLPFACPIEPEQKGMAPQWKQLDFLDYGEASFNLEENVRGLEDDYDRIEAFHQWMLETFKKAPPIPLLVGRWKA